MSVFVSSKLFSSLTFSEKKTVFVENEKVLCNFMMLLTKSFTFCFIFYFLREKQKKNAIDCDDRYIFVDKLNTQQILK